MRPLDSVFGTWLGTTKPLKIRLESKEEFIELLNFAVREKLSDLIIQTGKPVLVSHHGNMIGITKPLKKITVENIMRWVTNTDGVVSRLQSGHDFDAAFTIDDRTEKDAEGYPIKHRFRLSLTSNYYAGDVGYQAVMRYIKQNPPTFEDVQLEPEIIPFLDSGQGAVVFSGATGSGKTSTIAASIVNVLQGNTRIVGNILTYEQPIEFVFDSVPSADCVISQHEIGIHLHSFDIGVRNSLRRKAGLIMIGELRDMETITAAAEAANNGSPIYTTTHANSVVLTPKRLFEKFPPSYQTQAFYSILSTTNLIVAQTLVPHKEDTTKYVCLREWLAITNDERLPLERAGPAQYDREMQSLLNSKDMGNKARSMLTTVRMKWQEGQISTNTALSVLRNFGHYGMAVRDLEQPC